MTGIPRARGPLYLPVAGGVSAGTEVGRRTAPNPTVPRAVGGRKRFRHGIQLHVLEPLDPPGPLAEAMRSSGSPADHLFVLPAGRGPTQAPPGAPTPPLAVDK